MKTLNHRIIGLCFAVIYSLLLWAAFIFIIGCSNPADSTAPLTGEVLIYERLGLVDSVTQGTHTTSLGVLDFTSAARLHVKYRYTVINDSMVASQNSLVISAGTVAVYSSGSHRPSPVFTAVDTTVIANIHSVSSATLSLSVFQGCRVIAIRDLQIYKN